MIQRKFSDEQTFLARILHDVGEARKRKINAQFSQDRCGYCTQQQNTGHGIQRRGDGAPHCIDQGPEFCLRRSIGAHDADKYNYCISSHAEVNAIDQAARFGISLDGAVLYCTLEPCNWCFKQLIQAGIKGIYFEESYDSQNKEFDLYWRRIMESNESVNVFKQIGVSKEALDMVMRVLAGSSTRRMPATSPHDTSELHVEELVEALDRGHSETSEGLTCRLPRRREMKILAVEKFSEDHLIEGLRKVTMLKAPEVKVYSKAFISLEKVSPASLSPPQKLQS